jgi:hypothetical protein
MGAPNGRSDTARACFPDDAHSRGTTSSPQPVRPFWPGVLLLPRPRGPARVPARDAHPVVGKNSAAVIARRDNDRPLGSNRGTSPKIALLPHTRTGGDARAAAGGAHCLPLPHQPDGRTPAPAGSPGVDRAFDPPVGIRTRRSGASFNVDQCSVPPLFLSVGWPSGVTEVLKQRIIPSASLQQKAPAMTRPR